METELTLTPLQQNLDLAINTLVFFLIFSGIGWLGAWCIHNFENRPRK